MKRVGDRASMAILFALCGATFAGLVVLGAARQAADRSAAKRSSLNINDDNFEKRLNSLGK